MRRVEILASACGALACLLPAVAFAGEGRLLEAAKGDQLAIVRTLLADRVDPRERGADGTTALHWAAHWDDLEMSQLLLHAGADVNSATDAGVTPLALASVNGSLPMVDALLGAGANPRQARSTGVSPLMEAARSGNVGVVRRLLVAGAVVNEPESTHGQNALMWAVGEGHLPVVEALIEAGAKVSASTPPRAVVGRECCMPNYVGGFTPLLFAVQRGNIDVARVLLTRGADVNEATADGTSALVLAIDSAPVVGDRVTPDALKLHGVQEKMAGFLLEQGADPNLHGAGRTALHSAVQRKMPGLVTRLLARGADPNARLEKPLPPLARLIGIQNGLEVTAIGATPFWLAAGFGDVESMRILLAGGADPSMTSNDGTTALMVAAGVDFVEGQDKYGVRWFRDDASYLQQRAIEAIKMCLDAGNDVNAANRRGQTALFGAVYLGGTSVAQLLVDNGANLNAINQRGQTAWLVAVKGEYRAGSFYTHRETGDLLETLGADKTLGADLGRDFERVASRPQ